MNQETNTNSNQPIPEKEAPIEKKSIQETPPQPAVPLWSFGKLLSYSWKYYKPLIKKIWPLIGFLFMVGAIRILYELFFPTPASPQDLTEIVIPTLLGVLSGIINMAFMGFVIPVVSFILLHSFYEQVPESLNNALKKVIPLAMPYTIVVFFSGLIMIGGYFLFIIPGIIFGIWLTFSIIVLIIENRRGFEALLRSAGLVLGHSWDVFWRVVGAAIVGGTVAFLLNLPILIVFIIAISPFYSMMRENPAAVQELISGQLPFYLRIITSLGSLWSNLITLLVLPFSFVFTYLLFRNLKQIKGEAVAYDKKKLFGWLIIIGIIGLITLSVGAIFLAIWGARYIGDTMY